MHLRHSFCSRLLFTVIPARCYHGDTTIFKLLESLAEDCASLFQDGLDVPRSHYILHTIILLGLVRFSKLPFGSCVITASAC